MSGRIPLVLLAAAALAAGTGGGPAAGAPLKPARTLTVFAAASLNESFADLGRAFESRHTGLAVRFQFAGSPTLVAQLVNGAGADVLATADVANMNRAGAAGLLAGPPQPFARNRLVAIVTRTRVTPLKSLADFGRPGAKVVLAADAVPAGRYARAALLALDEQTGFGPGFAARVLRNVVSNEEDVRGVLAKVALGEADAGIVYRTDMTAAAARHVRALPWPRDVDVDVRYPIAALAGAADSTLAQAFVAFVRSAEGQRILAVHGFLAAP
jgi:molybdate transport system substrate-binding protein